MNLTKKNMRIGTAFGSALLTLVPGLDVSNIVTQTDTSQVQAATVSQAIQAARYSVKQGNGIGVYILLAEKDVAKLARIKQIIAQKYQGKVPYQVFVSEGRTQQDKTVIALFIKGTMYGGKAYLLSGELLKAFEDSVPYFISVKDFDPKAISSVDSNSSNKQARLDIDD